MSERNIAQMFEGPAHNLVWKNRYNQMIGDAYQSYCKRYWELDERDKIEYGSSYYNHETNEYEFETYSKEEFVDYIKTDDEFANKWGVKIIERELSFDERTNYGIDILGYESLLDYGHSQNDDDIILELLNIWNVPTKKYRLEYKNEIVEYYE